MQSILNIYLNIYLKTSDENLSQNASNMQIPFNSTVRKNRQLFINLNPQNLRIMQNQRDTVKCK